MALRPLLLGYDRLLCVSQCSAQKSTWTAGRGVYVELVRPMVGSPTHSVFYVCFQGSCVHFHECTKNVIVQQSRCGLCIYIVSQCIYHVYVLEQEYIIERESILLHYGPVLQHFTGVMTFVMIFTGLRPQY